MKTEIKLERSKLSWSGSLKTVIAYFVMVLFFFLLKPGYLGASNIRTILIQTALLGIIGSGMTLAMFTGGVDMSVGAVAGVSTLAALYEVAYGDMPLAVGLLIGIGLAAAIGLINGFCVSQLGVAPFVATLGTMFLAQGMQYMFSDGGQAVSYGIPKGFTFLGAGSLGPIPMPIIIYLVVFIILFVVTELTPAGRYFRGTGLNQFASELSGIRIRMYTLLSYVICSLTAAILGLVLCASQSYASPDHGNSFMMDSLLAVLLGKTLMNNKVSIYATAFGALFLRSFENGLSMIGLPVTLLSVCKGILLVVVLLLTWFVGKKKGKK